MDRPDAAARSASHGRGGAGNINNKANKPVDNEDLRTPTIKQQHYTTGRGGTGNIVSNDNPDNARRAQDVDTPEAHSKEQHGTYHWGRGGEGNKMTLGDGDKRPASKTRAKEGKEGERRGSFKGAMEKAKEAVGLGKKKENGEKEKAESGSAISD